MINYSIYGKQKQGADFIRLGSFFCGQYLERKQKLRNFIKELDEATKKKYESYFCCRTSKMN